MGMAEVTHAVLEFLARNWAIVASVCTIALLLLIVLLVIGRYARIFFNILRSTKPPLSRSPLDYEPFEAEVVDFAAYDGLRLSGMLVPAAAGTTWRGTIIFAHEYTSDMRSAARYCRALQRVGYDIFAFDFRGHGRSDSEPGYTPRQWLTERELYDFRGAIAYVRRQLRARGRPERIGAFGISRGACAAIVAAAETDAIRAIVADGAYSTDRVAEYFMKRWAEIFGSNPMLHENYPDWIWRFLRWIMLSRARRRLGCTFPSVCKAVMRMKPRPILFIHGERDSYLPVEQSRLLYALAGQPKYLWIAEGARHNQAVVLHAERYALATVRFFDRHLAGRPAATPAHQPAAEADHAEPR